ncbi:MAG: hypothetical protein IAE79_04335 [Anaerolinea sp.]|nr:hypothetical protein [Anaerolinea sp.]
MKSNRIVILLAVILLLACSCGRAVEVEETPIHPDAQAYAAALGVSLEEASRRLQLQNSIGELGAALQANEADTFAGLWLEHEPAYKVVVAFVGDGEEVIRPYLTNPALADIIEIRAAQYTLAELQTAQQDVSTMAEQPGAVAVTTDINVMSNQVVLTVGNPDLFLQTVTAAGYTLPPMVVVQPIDPANISVSNTASVAEYAGPDGRTIYFPRQAPTEAGYTSELEGTLILDENGCLWVRREGDPLSDPFVILWHYDFSLSVNDEGIVVRNRDGEPVGRVGDWMRMGGAGHPTVSPPAMPAACPGPYWILGGIDTMAEQAIPRVSVQPITGRGIDVVAVFHAQSKAAANEGSLSGRLTIDGRCFRVNGYTILWPPDIWPNGDADPIQIVYRKDDVTTVMFAVGDEVVLAGGEKTVDNYRFLANDANCSGPFWGAAALTPQK